MHNLSAIAAGAVAHVGTAQAPQTAEPLQVSPVVRKLFMLLHGSYGALFLGKFSTGEKDAQGRDKGIRAAMKVWDAKLASFPPDVVEKAADRLSAQYPDFPPNLPQFEAVCRAAMPRTTYAEESGLPRLAAPVAAQVEPVNFVPHGDAKDWARRLLARHEAGDSLRPIQLRFARQALGMEGHMPWQ